MQKPSAGSVNKLLDDLEEALGEVKKDGQSGKGGDMVALYGASSV